VLPPDDLLAWASAIRSLVGPALAGYRRNARSHSAKFVRSCVDELTEMGIISFSEP